jgi:hypothetical protein
MKHEKKIFFFGIILFAANHICAAPVSVDSEAINRSAARDINRDTISTASPQSASHRQSQISLKLLPYPFYCNLFKFGVGGFASVKGLVTENSLLKAGGFVSSNSSILAYLQYEDFQVPYLERIFIRPDLLAGELGTVKNYADLPLPRTETFSTRAGANNSDKDNYFDVKGDYGWYECTFGYLLPIGYGKDHVLSHPVLQNGILVSGETGGYSLNPFISGRTFLQTLLIYRSLAMTMAGQHVKQVASGVEFSLREDNVDYIWNPTRGYNAKLSYLSNWDALGGSGTFEVVKADVSCYFPLTPKESKTPSVLALDFKTANTTSWNDFDSATQTYNRPPNFIGAYLGGPRTMRAYSEFRYYDCSSIYYCAEYRKILSWNPLNSCKLTKAIGVDWIQAAFFGELGRVAPEWNIKELHQDMKWDLGAGLRFFMNGFLIRIDCAYGKEGGILQMYYNYSF